MGTLRLKPLDVRRTFISLYTFDFTNYIKIILLAHISYLQLKEVLCKL